MASTVLFVASILVMSYVAVVSTQEMTSPSTLNNEQVNGSVDTNTNVNSQNNNNNAGVLNISLEFVLRDVIHVSWTFQKVPNSNISMSGFLVGYSVLEKDGNPPGSTKTIMSDGKAIKVSGKNKDATIDGLNLEFRSPILGETARSFVFHPPRSRDLRVCVYVRPKLDQGDETSSCSKLSNPSNDDKGDDNQEDKVDVRKIASGVSAGCVFLIPCIVLLIYIMRKDKQMRRSMYKNLQETDHLNPGFTLKDEQKSLPSTSGNFKPTKSGRPDGAPVDKEWQTLSVHGMMQLKKENGPTIYIHTNDEEMEDEGLTGSYSVRL